MPDPLVSCVMPTFNRGGFLPAAVECFLRQTYQNKELIILDDSTEPAWRDEWRGLPIRYVFDRRRIMGAKRNAINEMAQGEIICHFDDDDWSDPDRVRRQVEAMQTFGKPVTGYSNIYYWLIQKQEARQYQTTVKGYVCGGTLCYLKSWWERHKFPEIMRASDNAVVYPNLKDIAADTSLGMYVARAHDSNVGGDKRQIGQLISKDLIPTAFWENENLRRGC